MQCPRCKGSRFVCEEHTDRAWPAECPDRCAVGMPCSCIAGEPAPTIPGLRIVAQLQPPRRR